MHDRVEISSDQFRLPAIRAGEARDLDAVARLQAASPEAAQWPAADYLDYEFRVADAGGGLAGFAVWRRIAADECELLNLVVAPAYRRRGIGRQLIASLLTSCGDSVFLEVRESNSAARYFYKSLGFQEVSVRKNYYSSPLEAAIVMKFHSC